MPWSGSSPSSGGRRARGSWPDKRVAVRDTERPDVAPSCPWGAAHAVGWPGEQVAGVVGLKPEWFLYAARCINAGARDAGHVW